MSELAVLDGSNLGKLQMQLSQLPQYEPKTEHFFHGGMYCRKVWREAGVLVIGKVHKKEHFYLIVDGTVRIEREEFGPGSLILSKPGSKRAVLSLTDVTCMTFHRCEAKTVEDAERELVEDDMTSMYEVGNQLRAIGQDKNEVVS